MTPKQLVLHSLQKLPDDATMGDIQERVNFIAAVEQGVREADEGKTIPHEKIVEEFAQWLSD